MPDIKQRAQMREREKVINLEKLAAKQLQREGQHFDDKQKFMSESYRLMLEANKRFEAEDSRLEEYNKTHSAMNKVPLADQTDMSAFYKKMYSQDMMFGGPRVVQEADADGKPQMHFEIDMLPDSDPEAASPARQRSRSAEKPALPNAPAPASDSPDSRLGLAAADPDPPASQPAGHSSQTREEKVRLARERLKQRHQEQAATRLAPQQ